MAVTTKVLIPAAFVNGAGPVYVATGVTTIIDKFTARNNSAGNVDLLVYLPENLAAASDGNLIVRRTLAAGETYIFPEMVGQVLAPGGKIQLLPSVYDVISVRVCGREIN